MTFRGQILRNPMICHFDAYPESYNLTSFKENENSAFLSAESVRQLTNYYNPPPMDIRFSALLARDLSSLAPAYIQVSGGDPLRDDGLVYGHVLENAGFVHPLHFHNYSPRQPNSTSQIEKKVT